MIVEVMWGGCPTADRGDAEELQRMVGEKAWLYGQPGTVESIEKIAGMTPWIGIGERPQYLIRFRPESDS